MKFKGRTKKGKVGYILTLLFLCIVLYFAYQFYQENNFNDFIRSESNLFISEFKRDSEVKYSKQRSYRIVSPKYNDAMFYKKIKVEKNKPYKVTCMVKTEGVILEENNSGIGAQISIEGSTERSIAILGTSDWHEIELIFNSKNREEVNIGFRLGGYLGNAKGTAWFSDFKLEEGIDKDDNNEWKFACFIFKNTDVTIDGNQTKLSVTNNDIRDISDTILRFATSANTLSNGKMKVKYDVFEIDEALNKLSYDKEFAYYVAPEDIENQIKDKITGSDYDHIFVVIKLRR
ncbi:MAG: hypothetical protein U0L98_03655 [Clostridia bacterium]|nr:hypothetical protein [Clostridia bacterium]